MEPKNDGLKYTPYRVSSFNSSCCKQRVTRIPSSDQVTLSKGKHSTVGSSVPVPLNPQEENIGSENVMTISSKPEMSEPTAGYTFVI